LRASDEECLRQPEQPRRSSICPLAATLSSSRDCLPSSTRLHGSGSDQLAHEGDYGIMASVLGSKFAGQARKWKQKTEKESESNGRSGDRQNAITVSSSPSPRSPYLPFSLYRFSPLLCLTIPFKSSLHPACGFVPGRIADFARQLDILIRPRVEPQVRKNSKKETR